MSNDHLKMAVRELTNVGIKPEIEKTNGGHTVILWEVGGRSQRIVTSSTPSDHRAGLNVRARVRRLLRDAGVYDRTEQTALEKALSVPVPLQPAEPLLDRVAHLEEDVGALLDLVIEVQMKSYAEGWSAHAQATQKAMAEIALPAPVSADDKSKLKTSKRIGLILLHLDYDWTSLATIRGRCREMTANAVSVLLTKAKQKGLVENKAGKWRKVRR